MKKKVVYGIILFVMTFSIFSTVSNVFALDGYYANTYKKGDQFTLVKNAYKYNKNDGGGLFNNWFEQDDSDEYFCKKGETVTYQGEYGTDGIFNIKYYMKVKRSDGQIGYINCANIEPIEGETSRPATLKNFISKYNVKSYITNDADKGADKGFEKMIREITQEYNNEYISEFSESLKNFYYNNRVKSTETDINSSGFSLEERMSECEYEYTNLLKTPSSDSKDSVFIIKAYVYAYTYCTLDNAIEVKNEVDEDIKKLEEEKGEALEFEDYYNSWKDETDASKKAEWATRAINAYQESDKAEQEKYSDEFKNLIDETAEDEGESLEDINEAIEDVSSDGNMTLYKSPILTSDNDSESDVATTIDDVIEDGKKLLNHGSQVDSADISKFSQSLNSLFLTIGIVIAVIVGVILGLQFMFASVEGKAEVKKMVIVYIIGCVVIFASFAIWKLVVDLLGSI